MRDEQPLVPRCFRWQLAAGSKKPGTVLSLRASVPIPVLINPHSGSAKDVRDALQGDPRFALEDVAPEHLGVRLGELVSSGVRRIAVSGGDGSIASAAGVLAGTGVELAVIPGGTLNHFARDHDIPTDPRKAAEVAAGGACHEVDVGDLNGRIFLNTSSVGAYVTFVRTRERLERWKIGYRLATVLAALRILFRLPRFNVHLEAEGEERSYRVCLVFVGVDERSLDAPAVGGRAENGGRGLHVFVVRNAGPARLVAFALAAAFRGLRHRRDRVESFLVEQCRIELPRARGRVATDGEVAVVEAPLNYTLKRSALLLVEPERGENPGR